jgi:DNA-binding NarL/FixJ family response regulator
MANQFRTVVVDDHPIFRQGLCQIISAEPFFQVVGEAGDGIAGYQAAVRTKPDLILLDINLPGLGGLEVAERLQKTVPTVKVVILTMHKEEDLFNLAMNYNVKGYVLKETAGTELVNCLRAVAAGEYFFTPSMSGCLLRRRHRTENLVSTQTGLGRLTAAEQRILKGIASNQTSKQIATELGVSYRTVEAHRANMCTKLEMRGAHSLLHFALQNQSALG